MGHKGFSLVEVIVSLAIMTIVGGAVSAFLIAGNNSYIRGNRDLTLQEETQLTTNQMIDLIIDVQNDIKFNPESGYTAGPQIDNDGNVISGTSVDVRELFLYNDDTVMVLRWQGGTGDAANEVFLLEASNTWVDSDGNEVAEGTDGAKLKYGDVSVDSASVTRSLLAQYVTDFSVDLSELSKRKVKLNLTFEIEGKTYDVSETIKLRNDFNKNDTEEYYWITGIEISPNPVTIVQGDTVQFTYTMSGDKGAIDEGVTWSWRRFDGNTSDTKTTFDSGKLSIGKDEPVGGNGGEGTANSVIEVTVTSVADPSKSATAWVSVKKPDIESIYIVPDQTTLMQGDDFEFECVIVGTPEAVAKGVKEWKVEGNNGKTLHSETTITPIGDNKMKAKLHVSKDQLTGMNVIKITAQAAAVSTAQGRAEAYVSVNKYSSISGIYDVRLIATNLTYYELDSSGTLGYLATIECLTSYADYANGYPIIKWEETTLGSQAYTLIDDPTEMDTYTGYMTPNYVTNLYCGTQSDTHAYVKATVQLDAENSMVVGIDITIPPIERTVSVDSAYIDSDNFVLYRGGSVNLELKGIDESIPDDSITWEVTNRSAYSDLNTSIASIRYANNSAYTGDVYPIGFGNTNVGWLGDNGKNEAVYNPEGTGKKTVIRANSYKLVDLSSEYRLTVVAKVDGKEVASTNVLVPRFDFTFPNGQRYMTVDAPSYHYDPGIDISVYGIATNAEIGLSGYLDIDWELDEALKSNNTKWSDERYHRVAADRFVLTFQIGSDEKNDMITIQIKDRDIGDDSLRNLILYVNH
jgi:prepilin-type N-terminal cleavage/methylation domain-containing protein